MSTVDDELVSLPADGRAAGLARTVVRTRLQTWQLDHLLDVAMLLTSEVVTNVVVHTASAPSLLLARDRGGVRVTVVDESPTPPLVRRHSLTAMTGRGLLLLQDLADDWGWDPVGRGKAVWFLLRGTHDPWAGPPVPPPHDHAGAVSADGARELDALMSQADEFCRSAQLITLARTPAMVRLGHWYVTQVVDQVAGRPPIRWDGPLDPP